MNRGPAQRYTEDYEYERGAAAGRPGTYLQDNSRRESRRAGGRGRGGAYYDDRRLDDEEYGQDLDEPY